MSTEHENLQGFALDSVKMHLSNRHAVSVLRTQIQFLSRRIAHLEGSNQDFSETVKLLEETSEEAFKELDERTDALLTALEKVVNG